MAYAHNLAKEINVYQSWIKELEDKPDIETPEEAYAVIKAVLQTLRDRLSVNEAANLSAQLPLIARGIFYEGWKPSSVPNKYNLPEFFGMLRDRLDGKCEQVDEERLAGYVIGLLRKHVSGGEMDDVKTNFPKEFSALFN